jgi:hypothetical protein
MEKQTTGSCTPQISMLEAAQVATEEAVDQFCWSVAQVLKRILDPAPPAAGDGDVDNQTPGGQEC